MHLARHKGDRVSLSIMEWKSYYEGELRTPGTREKIEAWLRDAFQFCEPNRRPRRREILSFPHTAIDESGPLQARVVASLVGTGVRRVIALGVLHGAQVEPMCVARDMLESPSNRNRAFGEVRGAFCPCSTAMATPFGRLELGALPLSASIREDERGILHSEFSLDTFGAILRLAADICGTTPPYLVPLYVGMTRHPVTGSFESAERLAQELGDGWDDETAIVTTGDVVHYGAVYGPTEHGASTRSLRDHFLQRLREVLRLAIRDRDLEGAHQISEVELRSDQREILPVLSYLLGVGAEADIVSFALSDYAPIFDIDPPCLVASSLIAYMDAPQGERAGVSSARIEDL